MEELSRIWDPRDLRATARKVGAEREADDAAAENLDCPVTTSGEETRADASVECRVGPAAWTDTRAAGATCLAPAAGLALDAELARI